TAATCAGSCRKSTRRRRCWRNWAWRRSAESRYWNGNGGPRAAVLHGSFAACSGQVAHQLAVGHRVAGAGAAVAEDAVAADAEGADHVAAVVEIDAQGTVARLGDGESRGQCDRKSEGDDEFDAHGAILLVWLRCRSRQTPATWGRKRRQVCRRDEARGKNVRVPLVIDEDFRRRDAPLRLCEMRHVAMCNVCAFATSNGGSAARVAARPRIRVSEALAGATSAASFFPVP